MIKFRFLYQILIILLFYSCVNTEEYEKIRKDFQNVEYFQTEINLDSIINHVPNYSEISTIINKSHKIFRKDILLNCQDASLYNNSKETIVALGMYTVNLGYVRHFGKVQMCSDYIEVIEILSSKLAINSNDIKKVIPEIEMNLINNQNMFHFIDNLLNIMDNQLSDNEKYVLCVLFLGGIWIESAYISLFEQNDITYKGEIITILFNDLDHINFLFDKLNDGEIITDLKTDLLALVKGKNGQNIFCQIEKIRNKYKK